MVLLFPIGTPLRTSPSSNFSIPIKLNKTPFIPLPHPVTSLPPTLLSAEWMPVCRAGRQWWGWWIRAWRLWWTGFRAFDGWPSGFHPDRLRWSCPSRSVHSAKTALPPATRDERPPHTRSGWWNRCPKAPRWLEQSRSKTLPCMITKLVVKIGKSKRNL